MKDLELPQFTIELTCITVRNPKRKTKSVAAS